MARILAIDYGLKRVGLAVTDPLQIIATALDTVEEKRTLDYLKKYFEAEEVETIVVGEPKTLNNDPSQITEQIEKFVVKLKAAFPGLPIHRVDERFTSKMAAMSMVESGVKKKERRKKENLDKISATLILQSYLQLNQR